MITERMQQLAGVDLNEGIASDQIGKFIKKVKEYAKKENSKNKDGEWTVHGGSSGWSDDPVTIYYKNKKSWKQGNESFYLSFGIKSTKNTYDKDTYLVYVEPNRDSWRMDPLKVEVPSGHIYGTLMEYFKNKVGWKL